MVVLVECLRGVRPWRQLSVYKSSVCCSAPCCLLVLLKKAVSLTPFLFPAPGSAAAGAPSSPIFFPGAWSTLSGPAGRSRSRTFPELSGVSLWVFPQENRFRQGVYDLVTHKYFDYVMFVLIMLNCVAMAYEYPSMDRQDVDGMVLFWR